MKVVINIPKEFISHYKNDKFEDSLHRIRFDICEAISGNHFGNISGRYELELLDMLTDVFENSEVVNETNDD